MMETAVEETSIGMIIGSIAFITASIFACIALLLWRAGGSKSFGWFHILVYMLTFGIGVMYLVGTASLWDTIANGKWSEIDRPIVMFTSAISLTLVLPRIWRDLKKQSQAPS